MRRADRLFQLVQLVRGRRLSTAAWLAQRLEVSERTVYRDVADLQHQGVPIEGEAGVGYRMGTGFELPPLMFSVDEARALVASVRLAQAWLDPALAMSADMALGRVLSVLPTQARVAAQSLALYAPPVEAAGVSPAVRTQLQTLREATQARVRLRLTYTDQHARATRRTVRPLGCFYWGKVWTLAAWCEHRQAFRSFRVDRMTTIERLDADGMTSGNNLAVPGKADAGAGQLSAHFSDEPGRTLADFLRQAAPPDVQARWAQG